MRKKLYHYTFPHPALTVDILLFKKWEKHIEILLIKRRNDPFKDAWAIPGGFVGEQESLHTAALRELKEETSITVKSLKQFHTYGKPYRDPRGWTVSVVYWAQVPQNTHAKAGGDAAYTQWFDLKSLPVLAFDHHQIIHEFSKSIPDT